jgi:short-subunit dehydrogenase
MKNTGLERPLPPTPLTPRKRAILVGASSGIGAALAKQLAGEGWTLALLARRTDRLEELCAAINAASGETSALAYTHDVCDHQTVPALLQKIMADLGGLDLFIYNSGIALPGGIKHFEFDKDLRTTEVNYLGALAWLAPVASLFQSLKAGHIVGISSVAGDRGRIGNPSYNASKAALTSYLESLRNRLTRRGVHVLTVKPGYVATELTQGQKMIFPVATPEKTARDISRAIHQGRQQLYTPWFWGWIMLVVRHIPSFIFRRMSF